MRILIIEDERELARHVAAALTRNGHTATTRHDGPSGLQTALSERPDLIVLDLNLPGLDGYGIMEQLRAERSEARVLILTARGEVENRIKGLRGGADDYLAKPFSMEELVARVEALGRRHVPRAPDDLLRVDDLQMDVSRRRVTRGGVAVALSPREFELLHVLLSEPGRVFSRSELCERVWQRDHAYDTRTVEIFITRLRKKIDANSASPLILTRRTLGYCIRAPL